MLRTPAGHGDVLIEPAASSLARVVAANRQLLRSYNFKLLDYSAAQARAEARAACGMVGDSPAILSGHQPDFLHAGVWSKFVVASRLAEALGGDAANLAVDNDAPRDFLLRVPGMDAAGEAVVRSVAYARGPRGAAFEVLPSAECLPGRSVASEVRDALGPRWESSLAPVFFAAYCAAGGTDWVKQSLAGRHAVEAALGVRVRDVRVSEAWGGPLLGEMLANAPRFAASYNAALAWYRRAYRVRAADRPAPDLLVDGGRCELALWAYRAGEARQRVFVENDGAGRALRTQHETLLRVPGSVTTWHAWREALAGLGAWVLRPRALTLTLWARLLACDLFVHGIGGAKYDRATDALIRGYFGVEPPALACVSATLQWSPGAAAKGDVLPAALRRQRDFGFNPQRYVNDAGRAVLLAKRAAAVAESARLREMRPKDRAARRQAFAAIRDASRALAAAAPDAARRIAEDVAAAKLLDEQAGIARGREFFFALYPRKDLENLLAALPSVQALGGSTIV